MKKSSFVIRFRSPPSAKKCGGNVAEVWRPATTPLMHDTEYTMQDKGGNDLIIFIVVVKLA